MQWAARTGRRYRRRSSAGAELILVGIGLYFLWLRPALLPEDARYLVATLKGASDRSARTCVLKSASNAVTKSDATQTVAEVEG